MSRRLPYIVAVVCILLSACRTETYETGDGEYSHLHTDYVDVEVRNREIVSIVTDNGERLVIPAGKTLDVNPVDTTLRWMLYYSKFDDKSPVKFIGNRNVEILKPVDRSKVAEVKTDALTLIGVWLAPNCKYLNLRVGIKTGNAEMEDARQTIGLLYEKASDGEDHSDGAEEGNGKVCYTLYHDQGGVPQYYTQECIFSIPIEVGQKTIELRMNTYQGEVTHTFTVVVD